MGYSLSWKMYAEVSNETNQCTLQEITNEFNKDKPRIVAIDTETTGLNIIKDTPFLFIIAWKVNGINEGKTFVIEYNPMIVREILKLFSSCEYIIGANIKYDLHMLRNGGSPFPFEILNEKCSLTDVRILRRLTMESDANHQDERMALKQMAVKFIDANANADEKNIAELIRKQNLLHRNFLKSMLSPMNYKPVDVDNTIKDCRYGIEALPIEVRNIYEQWEKDYGRVTYKQIYQTNRFDMNKYAAMDGVFTIEVFLKLYETYLYDNKQSNNTLENVFKQENELIRIYYKQETIGFNINMGYLKQARINLAKYLIILEKELHILMGEKISENQHKELLRIYQTKYNIPKEFFINKKTGKETFDKGILNKLVKLEGDAGRVAKVITKLRRCRKWASTYVDGTYKEVLENGDGRLHPNSNQCGTVSGRISGNLQQQPKDPLYDLDGNEIFHPRKIIIPSGGDYEFLVLQDFDQMELRVQAHYTIQYNCIDNNLCKIFLPLDCYHTGTGELFNYNDPTIISKWGDKNSNGDSLWVDRQTNQPWVPIDPHGMHVESAFGYNKKHPDWKHLRNAAKTINFAVNYGSGLKGLLANETLEDYSQEIITKIYNSYKSNFKGVGEYQKIVNNYVSANLKISNMYGRIYKVSQSNLSYKCANYLVQGSCADLVKKCLIEIDKLFTTNHIQSRMLYTVHDEIIWELHRDEGWVIPLVENILNNTSSWCKIPLTCGTDLTHTNWSEKKDIKHYTGGN